MNDSSIPSSVPPQILVEHPATHWEEPVVARVVPERHRGSTAMAWAVVFAMIAFHVATASVMAPEVRQDATTVDLLQVNMMAKFLVGARKLSPNSAIPLNVDTFGPNDFPEPHWCEAILLNEFRDSEAALAHMDQAREAIADNQITLTERQSRLQDILQRLLADYADGDWQASSITPDERQFLPDNLGFSGTLAVTPRRGTDRDDRARIENNAVSFTLAAAGVGLAFFLVLATGFVGLIAAMAAIVTRKLRFRFVNEFGRSHVYIETFAVWFVLFTALQLIVGAIMPASVVLIGLGVVFFVSLLALLWPTLRGVSWADVRRDIGWKVDANPMVEVLCGIAAYVCLAPLILAAVLFVVALSGFLGGDGIGLVAQFDGRDAPSHPIVFELAKNDPLVIAVALVLACLAAPIIEETMFRGVLYRHLRDSTVWLRTFASVILSAGINSLIFAAIHPQGLLGIPVLGTLAFGFSIVREWRGSLIAPMTMHAINNGTMTVLLLLVLHSLA